MKLYTEEQVKQIFANLTDATGLEYSMEVYCDTLTPIELPSDEEIEAQSKKWVLGSQVWEKGAKWMKEQILNQNK